MVRRIVIVIEYVVKGVLDRARKFLGGSWMMILLFRSQDMVVVQRCKLSNRCPDS